MERSNLVSHSAKTTVLFSDRTFSRRYPREGLAFRVSYYPTSAPSTITSAEELVQGASPKAVKLTCP
jgi:hypothetical protein